VVVNRPLLRYWLAGMLSIPLILLALELAVVHRYFGEPETGDDGGLTNQGLSETRSDWAWAIGLTIAGLGLAAWSLRELGAPRQVLVGEDEGLFLAIGTSRRPEVFVPWHQVDGLRSSFVDGDTGPGPVLEIELARRSWVPASPVGASWEGRVLRVDAAGWRPPVHEVAGVLRTMLDRSRAGGEPVTLLDHEGMLAAGTAATAADDTPPDEAPPGGAGDA
jgi:hypothetical protein